MQSYKALSALMTYPEEPLIAALPEIRAVLRGEALLPPAPLAKVEALIADLEVSDLMAAQERYVTLFDRSRALSLHLFEHLHGESRDRGQAMVLLREQYREAGLEISVRELPDFLPLYLEYLSVLPAEAARERLAQPIAVIAAIARRLERRASIYAGLFSGIEALAAETPSEAALETLLKAEDTDPDDPAVLDREWEEDPVTFGAQVPGTGGAANCGRLMDGIRRVAAQRAAGAR